MQNIFLYFFLFSRCVEHGLAPWQAVYTGCVSAAIFTHSSYMHLTEQIWFYFNQDSRLHRLAFHLKCLLKVLQWLCIGLWAMLKHGWLNSSNLPEHTLYRHWWRMSCFHYTASETSKILCQGLFDLYNLENYYSHSYPQLMLLFLPYAHKFTTFKSHI